MPAVMPVVKLTSGALIGFRKLVIPSKSPIRSPYHRFTTRWWRGCSPQHSLEEITLSWCDAFQDVSNRCGFEIFRLARSTIPPFLGCNPTSQTSELVGLVVPKLVEPPFERSHLLLEVLE